MTAGLIKNTKTDVKILGSGELTKALSVTAHGFSPVGEGEDRGGRRHGDVAARRARPEEAEAGARKRPAAAADDEPEAELEAAEEAAPAEAGDAAD